MIILLVKITSMKPVLILCSGIFALFLCTSQVSGQALPADSIKTFMVHEWQRAKDYTADYLKVMPADKYSFRATDSVRTFAQQMLHLAQANLFFMSMISDTPPPSWGQSDLEHSATSASSDSVKYYVMASYDYCINTVQQTPVDKWGEMKKTFGRSISKFSLMMKCFEHQTHHRGQTTIYIRLVGIKPPNERLF